MPQCHLRGLTCAARKTTHLCVFLFQIPGYHLAPFNLSAGTTSWLDKSSSDELVHQEADSMLLRGVGGAGEPLFFLSSHFQFTC